ncbi:hypothetical protein FPV67DRAFT_1471163 [Lyophyllum atratum]|nr:hypothetical protein FPV67DRAFT_1471163 [Lyophyllum atratum]
MLSVWKRTWKQKDLPVNSQQDRLDEPSSSASILDFTAAAHPSDTASSAFLPSGDSGKRHLPDVEAFSGMARKRLKIDAETPLSEVDKNKVLEGAKRRNTIIITPPGKSTVTTIVQFLEWTLADERLRPNPATKRRRTTLWVVNNDVSLDAHATSLHSVAPDLSVGRYDVIDGSDEAEPWAGFLRLDVVIVNPAVLLKSLIRGTLAMTQFQALIFSNIFNDRGQMGTSTLQIMHNFYLVTDYLSRPRILGFAPLPASMHMGHVIHETGVMMDAKVIDLTGQRITDDSSAVCSNEVVLLYDRTKQLAVSTLLNELLRLDPTGTVFRKHFGDSRHALNEVGPCASDLVWRRALKEIDAQLRAGSRIEGEPISVVQTRMRDLIKNYTFVMPNLDPSSQGFNVSHKFLMLIRTLESCEPYGESFHGIVVVKQQIIALSIADLLRKLDNQLGFLRPVALLGEGSQRQEILHSFTAGVYNLLIIPQRDKDIDMPKVPIMIYFNHFESLADSGAFAVRPGTHLVHLVERDQRTSDPNFNHDRNDDKSVAISTYREALAPLAISQPADTYGVDIEDNYDRHMFIQDPTTSSRIYPRDSVGVVGRIASSGLGDFLKPGQMLVQFEEQREGPRSPCTFICTVTFPGLEQARSPACTSKDDAKCAACYRLCESLASAGVLDYRFFPPSSSLRINPTFDSGKISTDLKPAGTRNYIMKDPDFWTNTKNLSTLSLYPMIISTTHTDEDMQPYAPLVLLTRKPLPDLPSLRMFYSGVPAVIDINRGAALRLEETQLHDLYLYTLRVCRIISNKPFDCSLADMVYFIAPLTPRWTTSKNSAPHNPLRLPSIAECIPWDLVNLAANSYITPLKSATFTEAQKDIQDAVIQDRAVEFTRRYTAIKMRPDLSPLSKLMDSPREAGYDNLLAFCKARKGFEGLRDEHQPLIEISTVPAILNQLNPTSRPLSSSTKLHAKYLIPELCFKCTIPASTLRTARLLPSVTRRIDDLLLVKELNAQFFDHAISDKLLHMALCTPSCGVEYDYERLELLGDAFLKHFSSIYVFVAHPAGTEGVLHTARKELISNKYLFQQASRIGLPTYIQSKLFTPKFWYPPGFTVPGPTNRAGEDLFSESKEKLGDLAEVEPSTEVVPTSCHQSSGIGIDVLASANNQTKLKHKRKKKKRKRGPVDKTQWLGDKAVADVAEAIMGAGYLTGGEDLGLKIAKALGIPISDINMWTDFGKRFKAAPPKLRTKLKPESIAAVQGMIGYKFDQPHLLSQALTHSSVPDHEFVISERLEFIGDAILDFMVIRHLYDREQHLTPGGLTLLKGAMVSNSTLAAICVLSGLYEHFLYKSHVLQISIQDYITRLKASQAKEYKNADKEGRPPGQFWLELSAPKTLSDIVESVLGAVHVADDFSSKGVDIVFDKFLRPFYEKHITLKTLSHHPTKLLFELFQRRRCRQFKTSNETKERKMNVAHIVVHDVVLASAEDPDPNIAARRASFFALDALEGDPGFFARTCDCRIPTSGEENATNKKANRALEAPEGDSQVIGDTPYVYLKSEAEEGIAGDASPQKSDPEEGMIEDETASPKESEPEEGMILE